MPCNDCNQLEQVILVMNSQCLLLMFSIPGCLISCSVLGQGVLGVLQLASAAGLVSQGVRCVPEAVCVRGQLVNTLLDQPVSGFDLSAVKRYKWHPTMEHIAAER